MIKKTNPMAWMVALIFLVGSAGEGAAFQEMTCKAGIPAGGASKTCKTIAISEGEARMVCGNRNAKTDTAITYHCTLAVRDQGASTPYAHTSRIWHCTADDLKIYVFNQDFSMDTARCALVCGRCEGNWEAAKPPR
jgi:hypothetical protein